MQMFDGYDKSLECIPGCMRWGFTDLEPGQLGPKGEHVVIMPQAVKGLLFLTAVTHDTLQCDVQSWQVTCYHYASNSQLRTVSTTALSRSSLMRSRYTPAIVESTCPMIALTATWSRDSPPMVSKVCRMA